jgi:hypothetical protein
LIGLGLLGDILGGLGLVAGLVDGSEIVLAILPAIDQCGSMIAYPSLADDLDAALLTDAIELEEDTEPHPRWDGCVISLADPLLSASRHSHLHHHGRRFQRPSTPY